jgi:hypothetical protein
MDFKWVTCDEAMETFTFDDQKEIMFKVFKYLEKLNK